jgi:hypothetical protein
MPRRPRRLDRDRPDRSRVIAAGEMDLACIVALNYAMSEARGRDVPIDLDPQA